MTILEYVNQQMKDQGINYLQVAESLGVSAQRFYQIIHAEDVSFITARKLLNAIGKDFDVRGAGGEEVQFDDKEMMDKMGSKFFMFSNAKEIIEAAGMAFYIVDSETHEGTEKREEIRI